MFAVGYFVQGVIIAMAFLPPTSDLFVSKRSNQARAAANRWPSR
jgi:hypothetical protein